MADQLTDCKTVHWLTYSVTDLEASSLAWLDDWLAE